MKVNTKSFLFSLVFAMSFHASAAQTKLEKYIVFVFESTREYSESGKAVVVRNNYYWISDYGSLSQNGIIYPLYLPAVDSGSIVKDKDSYILSDILNLNGSSDADMLSCESTSWYPLIMIINGNKTRIQSIKSNHFPLKNSPIKRKRERVNVYYVPVTGHFKKGLMPKMEGWGIPMLFLDTSDDLGVIELEKNETEFLRFVECGMFDYSSFLNSLSCYDKGFCTLKISE